MISTVFNILTNPFCNSLQKNTLELSKYSGIYLGRSKSHIWTLRRTEQVNSDALEQAGATRTPDNSSAKHLQRNQSTMSVEAVLGVPAATHVKTSVPQPAVSVKRRGPRSRAGFIAPPQFPDIDMEMPRTIAATTAGMSSAGAGVFLCSPKPRMHNISMPVPTT